MDKKLKISPLSIKRLQEQGLGGYTDTELACNRFGNRFAYFTCMTLVVIGLAFKSHPFLIAALIIAFLGMFPPRHPVDYLYNYIVRHIIGRPKLPPRTNQGRFACAIATSLLVIINYSFYQGNFILVYVAGAILLTSAFLVTFLDLCIPSKIYNMLFRRKNIRSGDDTNTATDGTARFIDRDEETREQIRIHGR